MMRGSKGTGNGEFIKPWGIAVDSKGDVYVSDQENPVVQKFDNNGKFITKWGSFGSGDGQFVHLHDVTVDSKDKVYVTDGRNNSRVEKFDNKGKFMTKWGTKGSGEESGDGPHGIVVDSSGYVYVVDTEKIQKFTSDGQLIKKWPSPTRHRLTHWYEGFVIPQSIRQCSKLLNLQIID